MNLVTIFIFILLSSPSSSSPPPPPPPLNLTKTLSSFPNFRTASSEFQSLQMNPLDPQNPITILVPDDAAFSAVGYKSLPPKNRYFVMKCHMIGEYLPPPLLQNTAQVWHLKETEATEVIGGKKYLLNFTATANGSVAVSNSFVHAMVTRMVFDHRPVVIYGVSKVGHAFVGQYYHMFHESPQLVYRFYQEVSQIDTSQIPIQDSKRESRVVGAVYTEW
ncbi:nuclear transport factor [Trifolium repens]|nr:nuclear transport factor [Trifolium repens]